MTDDAPRSLVVADKAIEAHNMVSLELVDPDGEELPAFSPGSHVDVTLPGGLVRQYSLCNSAADRHRYRIGQIGSASRNGDVGGTGKGQNLVAFGGNHVAAAPAGDMHRFEM